MSTFDGIIHEFPDIRVDFFRGFNLRPPLACFLSHVHSDHLAGLDTLRSPFVYCSAATREILLRLEKYPCRLNYAKGILEDPRMQTYKHLAKVLKPIPLDTPTKIELDPTQTIQVTLLDANHCAGAVMFLIEGNGNAVLYTGDIRSEPWWVNSIARNPTMVEYSTGLRTLDRIYLDTSILNNFPLQTKADGLRELLEKVARYPKDTIFHMQAWTYGYEEVWIALSKALDSKIHVDKYKMGVYKSLAIKSSDYRYAAQTHLTKEAPYLVGFTCGNNQREGCLTLDENVRIHSCEKGMGCKVIETKPIVWIQPIVAHLKNGRDMAEVGIGGGGDDLAQKPTLETEGIRALLELIKQKGEVLGDLEPAITQFLQKAMSVSRDVDLHVGRFSFEEEYSFTEILNSLARRVEEIRNPVNKIKGEYHSDVLTNEITFPYARHSSLPELRHFIRTFKPTDIWPCTVDPKSWAEEGTTIRKLFGDICTGDVFQHDLLMGEVSELRPKSHGENRENSPETQSTADFRTGNPSSPIIPSPDALEYRRSDSIDGVSVRISPRRGQLQHQSPNISSLRRYSQTSQARVVQTSFSYEYKRDNNSFQYGRYTHLTDADEQSELNLQGSQGSEISDYSYETRLRAYQAARANMKGDGAWRTINLISTTDNHSTVDPEL
ncbi:Metallo-hydrolase/oxidoreductase [Daldinia vernicosa]|uniref:Metallo-hydrolase/oxidoreductase n=1 Tax=Daldinia vernicosa TaxID=114800 RepID=UPI002007341A|nr:Metallo-hydrolase/oxidoreductase [Daldinia vernicosa]KAI0844627.1 Metallo-hydrolase/oxidoreductase [Daldinia vernicosa]